MRDFAYDQLINLQSLDTRASHTHTPNRQGADSERANRESAKR